MQFACSRSKVWLQNTVNSSVPSSCRCVSTTSAIHRGLRATKHVDERRSERTETHKRAERDLDDWQTAHPTLQRKGRVNPKPIWERRGRINIKKHTTIDDEPARSYPDERTRSASKATRGTSQRTDPPYSQGNVPASRRGFVRDRSLRQASGNSQRALPRSEAPTERGTAGERGSILARRNAYGSAPRLSQQHSGKNEVRFERNRPSDLRRALDRSGAFQSTSSAIPLAAEKDGGYARRATATTRASQSANAGSRAPIEQAISATVSRAREPLAVLQELGREPGDVESRSPSSALNQLRGILQVVNQNYHSGKWPGQRISSALKSQLPREQWGWRMTGETAPRLWLNRSESRIELVLKDGSSDSQVLENIAVSGREEQADSRASREHHDEQASPARASNKSESADHGPGKSVRLRNRAVNHEDQGDDLPISMPYTTAASTFLYGLNTVFAALQAGRRKSYKLHLHSRLKSRDAQAQAIAKMAKQAGISVVDHANTRMLDRMSEDRPHNGVVLEASVIPAPPVLSLGKANTRTGLIPLTVAAQSAEDEAINGTARSISTTIASWRHPLVVMLDGITDPGNVGAILRTCYFYGVDAVAVATNTCANLNSSIMAKASSGACEAIPILALPKPSAFVYECSRAGWKIFAAVAPKTNAGDLSCEPKEHLSTSSLAQSLPLTKTPCILVLGAEGEGLRENLRRRADSLVSIAGGVRNSNVPDVGVDSLNVSVAASILLESFLRQPEGVERQPVKSELGF